MDTFTLGPGRGWLARLSGRSPLVRRSDRVEALVLLLALVLVLVAAPVAGAVGTAFYSSRSAFYQEQAKARHNVTATVVQDSTVIVRPYSLLVAVNARWQDHGITHDGTFGWDRTAKAGEHLSIWVDAKGNYAGPPAPPKRAAAMAAVRPAAPPPTINTVGRRIASLSVVRTIGRAHRADRARPRESPAFASS